MIISSQGHTQPGQFVNIRQTFAGLLHVDVAHDWTELRLAFEGGAGRGLSTKADHALSCAGRNHPTLVPVTNDQIDNFCQRKSQQQCED